MTKHVLQRSRKKSGKNMRVFVAERWNNKNFRKDAFQRGEVKIEDNV